jgi:hypothetical protein
MAATGWTPAAMMRRTATSKAPRRERFWKQHVRAYGELPRIHPVFGISSNQIWQVGNARAEPHQDFHARARSRERFLYVDSLMVYRPAHGHKRLDLCFAGAGNMACHDLSGGERFFEQRHHVGVFVHDAGEWRLVEPVAAIPTEHFFEVGWTDRLRRL